MNSNTIMILPSQLVHDSLVKLLIGATTALVSHKWVTSKTFSRTQNEREREGECVTGKLVKCMLRACRATFWSSVAWSSKRNWLITLLRGFQLLVFSKNLVGSWRIEQERGAIWGSGAWTWTWGRMEWPSSRLTTRLSILSPPRVLFRYLD